jgi:beta-phosphoglucomutase
MIRAVVFDMDGVLIDAREWHYEALNRALGLVGFQISRFDHLSSYDGLPTRRKLEMLTVERGLPEQLHEFLGDLKQRYTMELVHTRCKPVFQHEYALARLKAGGYRLGVASNSMRSSVHAMLARSDLLDYFDLTLSNEDVEIGKPDPAIYVLAMSRLDVTPAETLIVEDNEHGVAAARASGAHVMVVGSPEAVTLDALRARIATAELART